LLDGVAADAGLEVTSEELGEAYDALSSQVEETAEELAARLSGTVQEKRITSDILRRKAVDALMRSAVAVDQDGTVLDLQLDVPIEAASDAPDETTVTEDEAGDGGAKEAGASDVTPDEADSEEAHETDSEDSPEESE
jgi:nitrogen fixation/metabolism regulation signal transduction histidine kinase